ncbi:MAG: hypothetical protein M3354_05840 [Chloroflexota bacterium]|nr:hypothetical protein [Chloroflexota bacterium]
MPRRFAAFQPTRWLRSPRIGLLLSLLLLHIWAPGVSVRARDGEIVATGLDLAAMALAPADLTLLPDPPDPPDPGFALASGGYLPVAHLARRLARARGDWTAATAEELATAIGRGWRGHYESRLAAPDSQLPGAASAEIESAITEYGDPASAAAAFGQFAPGGPGAIARGIPGGLTLGDESRLSRSFVAANGAQPPVRRMELMIRLGSLVVAVSLVDMSGERDWGVAAVEGLAVALIARVETVQSGDSPNLAPRLLRLDQFGQPGWTAPIYDLYDRRDGETYPLAGVDPEDAADRELLYGAASDVYSYERFLVVGDLRQVAVAPYYGVKLYRFPDAGAATAWLETAPDRLFADPGSFLDLASVEDAATIGDASRTIAYAFPASDTVMTRGYRIYARVGRDVARVQLDAEPEVALAVVAAFAEAQVACLQSHVCEIPPPYAPEELADLAATGGSPGG